MLKANEWLDKASIRKLAVEAQVDPRTISKIIEGKSVRGMAGARAFNVLAAYGLLPDLAPPEHTGPPPAPCHTPEAA